MSDTASEITGGPVFRFARLLALVCAIVGGAGTIGIMFLINADVIGRGAFDTPVPATAEIVSAAIVAIVYLQLPFATLMGRNIRSDMLISRVERRSPRAQKWLDTFHHAIGTIMLAILLYYIAPELPGAIEDSETVGLYGILQLPRWPFILAVVVGCSLTLVAYLLLTLSLAAAALRSESTA